MTVNNSENIFKNYLNEHQFKYEENCVVGNAANPKNVDFAIRSSQIDIFIDVKEVKELQGESYEINADANIRRDIKKLREKFGENRPNIPVILVTMNYSSNFFTGLTVAIALLGDVGINVNSKTGKLTYPLHHLPSGNAILTNQKHRTISGVLAYDRVRHQHCLFTNPYADYPIPEDYFPNVEVIDLKKDDDASKLISLSNIMF